MFDLSRRCNHIWQDIRGTSSKIRRGFRTSQNLKLKVEKCVLFEEEVEFLGHVVNRDGVKPNPNNTAKIAQWKILETVTQVRQFLGLCSYYRRFVKGFATIAKPLTELTQKNATLVWTEDCQKAFDNLKQQLLGENIMAYPQEKGEYILVTDASDFGIGAVPNSKWKRTGHCICKSFIK